MSYNNERDNLPRRKERKAILDEWLSTHPCVDCGESDPIVLEFDHRDPLTKLFNVTSGATVKSMLAEIAKCDVRCANCHKRKTQGERLQYPYGTRRMRAA